MQNAPDGSYSFHGCFHAVDTNKRVIQTFEFDGLPESGHVALERADFEANGSDKTIIRIVTTFQTVEDRDGMVATGMKDGLRGSFNALSQLVAA